MDNQHTEENGEVRSAEASATCELQSRFEEIYVPADDLPRRITDRYTVVSCLKYSDERRIYLLLDKTTLEKMILKCGSGENGCLLEHEYSILSELNISFRDGLPQVVEYFCENDMHYYIRNYIEGVTLDALMDIRGVMSPSEACAAVSEICALVQSLHEAKPPIICRDIKPENIVVCPDGKYRLIDLDTARSFKVGAQHDTNNLGTIGNAAPEQYGYLQTDKRTDVYALGMLLLFLVTGGYDKDAEQPPKIRSIVKKCTEFEPQRRYANAAALRKALTGSKAALPLAICAAALFLVSAALIFVLSCFTPPEESPSHTEENIAYTAEVTDTEA